MIVSFSDVANLNKRVGIVYKLTGKKPKLLGYLDEDLTLPRELLVKLIRLRDSETASIKGEQLSPFKHKASDLFTKQGKLRDLKIYSGVWKLTVYGHTSNRRVDNFTLEADIQYFAMRLAIAHNIPETSIIFFILKSAIRNTYISWKQANKK